MSSAIDTGPAGLRAPRSVDDTGLPFLFLVDLLAKVLFQRGQLPLPELSAHLKLGPGVIEPLVAFMRQEKMLEVTRRGGSGTDADLHYQLSESGGARAVAAMARNAYAGPCPVPLAAYNAQVAAQSAASTPVTRAALLRHFDGVVIDPQVMNQLGAAMNSGRAILLHGAAGSGKSYLAERLGGLQGGTIAVPYALMVDGEVLPVYDPLVHQALPEPVSASAASSLLTLQPLQPLDMRWVRGLRRPSVLSGGELTLEMLDLRFDSVTRLYRTPQHLKANNGLFIIDDLGRQRCSALELMNRWIVPMDRASDYLSLHNGHTFQVPFDVQVVFSSNFLPERLSDAAFLRRIGYKIEVPALDTARYEQVFRQACTACGVQFDATVFEALLQRHARQNTPLLACYPRDLLRQVRDLARYEGVAPVLNLDMLDWAWENYFADEHKRGKPEALAEAPHERLSQRRGHTLLPTSEEN
ncbi:ATP-binding protein [Janthinobacterium aquaticum]|uniref:ATP-binding protein n=1 Tax=Janthinobacterium sp. FT58W TaxID=2654254 RepID=UPI00186B41B7|nr:ATP-binding protein [Janthinobacterium sp. FT58W]